MTAAQRERLTDLVDQLWQVISDIEEDARDRGYEDGYDVGYLEGRDAGLDEAEKGTVPLADVLKRLENE
jgi:hypothetical protein